MGWAGVAGGGGAVTARLQLLDVYARLRDACALAGSQGAWARAQGLSEGHVSDVLNARVDPGPKMLAALGLKRVVEFVDVRRGNSG